MTARVVYVIGRSANKHSGLVVSGRDAERRNAHFSPGRRLPVTPFAAGIAAGGSGAGAVALGLARVFPRQAAHVLVGVGSPHGAGDREAGKHTHMAQDTVKLPNNRCATCVIQNDAVRCAKCAFQLHCRQPARPPAPLATMERLHQQSIGQRALSPNPACGRKVYSKPKTVIPIWRACVVRWPKSRTEQKAGRQRHCSLRPTPPPQRNRGNWAAGHRGGLGWAAVSSCQRGGCDCGRRAV